METNVSGSSVSNNATAASEDAALTAAPSPTPARAIRVAVVTMGVKLGDETRGYTRFRKISELLARAGFDVDLITSSFQHWEKAQRDTGKECYRHLPYHVKFVYEPGYQRNIDPARVHSHAVAARNLRKFFRSQFADKATAYDLIYSEIPPNNVARVCAEVADIQDIPYVADVNDLWPEAMRMVVNVPVVSDILFHPFARDAKIVYRLLSAAVGTSDEYARRPLQDRGKACPHITVYVGNDLKKFDEGAAAHKAEVVKPQGEFWVTYAGTLGASYDIETLIKASTLLNNPEGAPAVSPSTTEEVLKAPLPRFRVKILGDGPDRQKLEELAAKLDAPVDFAGYCDYGLMAAYLNASDVSVNSLVKGAVQSIVTKIGDYLAAGRPLINTGTSKEFCTKVAEDGFGVNVAPEDPQALAAAILNLSVRPNRRRIMGSRAREIAVEQFDQEHSYRAIVNLVRNLTK